MTLATTTNRIAYSGDGTTTVFPFPYKFLQDADLLVILRDASGVETTKTLTTHYTVAGEGEEAGGSVTMVTAPATGESLTIIREPAETQDLDLVENDPLPAEEVEERLDKQMMIQQRVLDKVNRAVRLTDGLAETFDAELPSVLTPSQVIGINAAGDGFELFAPTELTFNDTVVNVADHGAVGDGSTDDATALTAAIAAGIANGKTVYGVPGKTYRITSNVNFRNAKVDFSASTILVVGTTTRVIIGGTSSIANNPAQKFMEIYRSGGANSTSTVRCMGAKGQTITIDYVDYLDLYADTSTGDSGPESSIAYSTFHLNLCTKLVLTNNASTSGSVVQWINENSFFLKRTTTIIIEGTYSHNHNYFYTGTLESATITLTKGSANIFPSLRCEGVVAISCAAGTFANIFQVSYIGTPLVDARDEDPATFTDLSGRNYCKKLIHTLQRRLQIVAVTPDNCKSFTNSTTTTRANYTNIKGVDVQALGIRKFCRQSFSIVYDCPFIPVTLGDLLKFDADATVFRYTVRLYNSSFVQLTESSDASISSYLECDSGLAWSNSTDAYEMSANSASMALAVVSSAVAFIKFEIRTGNAVNTTPFTRFALHLITKSSAASALSKVPGNVYQVPAVASSPTRGFSEEIGMKVSNVAGGWFTCTFTLDTTITGAKVATDTVVTVTTVTGIASGDIVGLFLDDGTTHWTTVNGAPSGSDVTLTNALPSGAAALNRIVFNRWTNT